MESCTPYTECMNKLEKICGVGAKGDLDGDLSENVFFEAASGYGGSVVFLLSFCGELKLVPVDVAFVFHLGGVEQWESSCSLSLGWG